MNLKPKNKSTPSSKIKNQIKSELSDIDLIALEEFCNDIELEDISFEQWAHISNNLDLLVTYKISKEELNSGGSKTISFTRKITKNSSNPLDNKKVKVTRKISWPPSRETKINLTFMGEGDQNDHQRGNLIVTLECQ